MPDLPKLDPSQVEAKELHLKLLEGAIAVAAEREKAQTGSASEDHRAMIAAAKAVLDQALAKDSADAAADAAAEAAEQAKELELRGKFHEKVMDVAAAAIDRARDSAKFIQVAAAGLMTAYAALLALVFSATDRPLPVRGVYASAFLGLSIALAVAYLAFLKRGETTPAYEPKGSFAEVQLLRTQAFIRWVNTAVSNRRNALRAAVVAFALGVLFLPAAFVGPTAAGLTTTAENAPPSIPLSVPEELADDARKLFTRQVNDYLASLDEGTDGDNAEPRRQACTGIAEIGQACAWITEKGVERSFRRLAVIALAMVVLVPGIFSANEWRKRETTSVPTPSVKSAPPPISSERPRSRSRVRGRPPRGRAKRGREE